MNTIRLTAADAVVRFLASQRVETPQGPAPLFVGRVRHLRPRNVAGLASALPTIAEALPTLRAHNEQGMAHAAIAYAKAQMRRRMMAVTTSIGRRDESGDRGGHGACESASGALLPGDVFASRAPDPVLQQLEDFHDGTVSANDTLRPVSRYFDRIVRPSNSWPRCRERSRCSPIRPSADGHPGDAAGRADHGLEYPAELFEPRTVRFRAQPPADDELAAAAEALRRAKRPVIVAGGGALYGLASDSAPTVCGAHGVPVAETQAGKAPSPGTTPPAGRRGRDRLARGERSRPRCGPRARGWGPDSRTHDRLP